MTSHKKQSTEAAVREIRRRTRREFSPEEKIRIPRTSSVHTMCLGRPTTSQDFQWWSRAPLN